MYCLNSLFFLADQTHVDSPNTQAPTTIVPMNALILADNSTAVHDARTPPTINTTMLSFTGDSNFTGIQAPTHTPTSDLTSAFTGSVTPSTDFKNITSPPDVSPSPQGDGEAEPNCSGVNTVKVKPFSYSGQSQKLELDVPDHLKDKTLECKPDESSSAEYNFTLQNYTFSVSMCTPTEITCWFKECTANETFSINLDVPPKKGIYKLNATAETNSIDFHWYNTNGKMCTVYVTSNCSNGAKSFSGHEEVDGLDPFMNYSCTSELFYNKNLIERAEEILMTKIGSPEAVQTLSCTTTKTTALVTWSKPIKPNGPLSGYEVIIQRKDQRPVYPSGKDHSSVYTSDTDLQKLFTELEPFTIYIFKVTAYNKDASNVLLFGEPSEKNCMTEAGKPSKIISVDARVAGQHNKIRIDCKGPEVRRNGPEGQYILKINEEEIKKKQCQFIIENLNYLKTYPFEIYYDNTIYKGDPYTGSVKTKYNDRALIGFLAFFITITCLALIFVMYKIYNLQKRSSRRVMDNLPLIEQDDEKQLLNIEPIPVEQLLETYKRKNADEGRLFLDEFQSIPRVFSKFPIKEARKPCNQPKNRYIDILPYDGNRVVLSEIHGVPGSDYINASYINGFKEPRKYIAAQGPKEETMNDFWRMIWEQKSTIIVMVTRCEEGNRNKCAQYWPSNDEGTEDFGDVTVKITEEKFFPDYITRKLHITNRREKSERDITHIQFTVWPDHGVPDDPNLLLKLRRRVNALSNFFSGPIIVHCSAGVGRTGTYISIDAMLEGLEAENRVDVYGYVVQLRRQRCLMVQVESQYIFIHKSLVEYNQFGETEINAAELPHLLNNMKKNELPSEPSQLNCEFQRLPSYKNWRPQTTGNHPDNKDKNRNSTVVPYEFNRVQVKVNDEPEKEHNENSELSSDEDSDSEDTFYINASYITGYWGTYSIIAAQAPLKTTISEVWQMIYQKKIKAIVMLSGLNQENNEEECVPYWKEKSKTYDDLEVELTEENPCGSYTKRSFEIRHTKRKDIKKVSQFHYNQWEDVLPKETKDLLKMIEKVRKNLTSKRLEEQRSRDRSVPLLVHCSDGSQRTGTFCALWNLLESAKVEEVIDVFQTVKHLRRQRSGMVSSFEQYEFLYNTLSSTVPVQNGQVKITIHQEEKMETPNETKSKFPEEQQGVTASLTEDTPPKAKEAETVSNGPSAEVFTEVSLRIDE
ncbi:receptor-type tyrosine-protein phosphatase C isoform X1 [Bufo bufo]|uniref:receptor-type tyrosine-protein phosphatase C isoform X1 n=1 Tax=Bufo bufo TaxID=8384 RepID=UPI001ABEAB1E|nr:receptor-type tyrosine-protein phosphatase C isoform X1 [Bufo bufo]